MMPIRASYRPPVPLGYTPGEPYMASWDPTYPAVYDHRGGSAAVFGPSNTVPNAVLLTPNTRFIPQEPLEAVQAAPRRKRASKPKVKTGCITCKIRRVKCDEVKPACNRCTSTGRKCDGYEVQEVIRPPPTPPRTGQNSLQLPPSMSVVFQGTIQERQTFHRFQVFTVPAFAGGSENEFWSSLVLKAGIQEPVIRTAIIALATLHEDYQARAGQYNTNLIQEPSYQRALALYGRALRQLNERLATQGGDTAKLAIISSILFTCFEVLRRNDMTAIVHYRAGMRELMRHMNQRKNRPISVESTNDLSINNNNTLVRQIPQDELDILLRVFARYDVQACTFAKPKAEPLSTELPALPPTNLSLKDVRYHLDNLLVAAYQLIATENGMYRYWSSANVPADWQMHVTTQLRIFQQWHEALESFFDASELKLPPADAKSLLGLRLQMKVAIIMLKTSMNCGPESTFDQYKHEFEYMVTAVERVTQALALIDTDPLDRETTPFTMELGIVHPLFFVATKCRDSRLRRRAIAQLRKAGKEGVWEGPIMAVVAKKMMQIEQRGLISGQSVPERNRIHKLQKSVDYDGRKVMVELTLAEDDSWKHWETIREVIPF